MHKDFGFYMLYYSLYIYCFIHYELCIVYYLLNSLQTLNTIVVVSSSSSSSSSSRYLRTCGCLASLS